MPANVLQAGAVFANPNLHIWALCCKNGRLLAVIASSERLGTFRSRVCCLFLVLSFALTQKKQKVKTAEKCLANLQSILSRRQGVRWYLSNAKHFKRTLRLLSASPARKMSLDLLSHFSKVGSHCPGQPEMAGLIFVLKHMILSWSLRERTVRVELEF